MSSFATFEDLKLRYPSVSDEQSARVTALLEDATALITEALSEAGINVTSPSDTLTANLKAVCCSVVMRALPAFGDEAYMPLKSFQQMAGSFSENVTLANPTGDLYLTSAETKRLGITSATHGVFQFFAGADVLGPTIESG